MKKALIISLALNVFIISAFAIKRLYYSQRSAAIPSEWSVSWDRQKNDLYSAVPIDSGDIVFVGDSHIERFLLNEYFPCRKVRNRGIGSNTTVQVLARLDSILIHKPAKLFIQIGINDLSFGYSADSVYSNAIRIINRSRTAKTVPYLISVFPITGPERYLNEAIVQLNNKLSAYCSTSNILFIDMTSLLSKNSELDSDLTTDSCHLKSNGYTLLKKEIEQYIN